MGQPRFCVPKIVWFIRPRWPYKEFILLSFRFYKSLYSGQRENALTRTALSSSDSLEVGWLDILPQEVTSLFATKTSLFALDKIKWPSGPGFLLTSGKKP